MEVWWLSPVRIPTPTKDYFILSDYAFSTSETSRVVQGWLTPVFYLLSFPLLGSIIYYYVYRQAIRKSHRKYNSISPSWGSSVEGSTPNSASLENLTAVVNSPSPPKQILIKRHQRIFLPFVLIEMYVTAISSFCPPYRWFFAVDIFPSYWIQLLAVPCAFSFCKGPTYVQ